MVDNNQLLLYAVMFKQGCLILNVLGSSIWAISCYFSTLRQKVNRIH